jgi:Tfp pilus assembly protein PilX
VQQIVSSRSEKIFLIGNNMKKGFTLFIAMVVMATLMLVSTAIASLAVKGSFIYSTARDSQHAFYAADSGVECALYWDVKNPSGYSAFSTSTPSTITCNGSSFIVGGSSNNPSSTFRVTLSPDPYCADVKVTKLPDGSTTIESSGYNTCDLLNPRRVERAVRAVY